MAVGPIIMAAAMVAIMQEIRYALFAMLSPILSIGIVGGAENVVTLRIRCKERCAF